MLNAKRLVKSIITPVNRVVAHTRFVNTVHSAASSELLKIEVGSHATRRQGWICTDVSWRARHYLDATKRWPVRSASVSHVFADNMIEHIRMDSNRRMFREAHRVLVPGGRVRLATPDVEHIARIYLERGENARQEMERCRTKGYEIHHPVDLLRTTFQDCGHHAGFLWDFEALRVELESAGFCDVRRCAPGQSDDPVLKDLETRSEWALIVEAEATGRR
ncbi:methyltransferase domain-containing protein [Streptomyces sp. GC420]|uniref:class I SAM-dependent methyltransferase n=1 Tax=Streptomyces sp. GC420 TaxID=2697568 RepID=UPI0014152FAC|nr:methyltransferase domain-containing protein [Streptomyces sp. GC420]NBM16469.1 methyltransferase domain-containing protein [Streptomyces sp. GC420]